MNEIEQQGPGLEVKAYKKDVNKIAAILLRNGLIFIAGGICGGIAIELYKPGASANITLAQVTIMLFIISIAQIIFTSRYGKKRLGISQIFAPSKKMGLKSFGKIFSCAVGFGFFWSVTIAIAHIILSHFNIPIPETTNSTATLADTMIEFLWAGFVAPISEGIIFFGVILKAFKKYGKIFAIVMSAVLFGCATINFWQWIFKMCIGLVYGYVACEYSIKWTILLIIFNNVVIALGPAKIAAYIPIGVFNILYYGMAVIAMTTAVIVFIKSWKNIKRYISRNKSQRGCYKYAFRSRCILVVCGGCLLVAVLTMKLPMKSEDESVTWQSLIGRSTERMQNNRVFSSAEE